MDRSLQDKARFLYAKLGQFISLYRADTDRIRATQIESPPPHSHAKQQTQAQERSFKSYLAVAADSELEELLSMFSIKFCLDVSFSFSFQTERTKSMVCPTSVDFFL